MIRHLAIFLSLALASPAWAATYYASVGGAGDCSVGDPCSLTTALGNLANPADEVVAADGTYNQGFDTAVSGSPSNRVIIRAANVGGAILNATVTVDESWVEVKGFVFDGAGNIAVTGNNNRITRNTLKNRTGAGAAIRLGGNASNNLIDYNEITNWNDFGIQVNPNAGGSTMTSNIIQFNYGHDSIANIDGEFFKIGNGQTTTHWILATQIGCNYLEDINTDGQNELWSVKSSGNIIEYNTIIQSSGTYDVYMQIRHGENNIIQYNHLTGACISKYGDDMQVIGNVCIGEDMRLDGGNCTQDDVVAGCGNTPTPAARRWIVGGNRIAAGNSIIVGTGATTEVAVDNELHGNDQTTYQDYAVAWSVVGGATGTIKDDIWAGGDWQSALQLTTAEVGPLAPEQTCPPSQNPTVNITATGANAAEPNANGEFTVTCDKTCNLTVNCSVGGTATASMDYNAISCPFTLNNSLLPIPVTVIDDEEIEGLETVTLTLMSGTGYTVGAPSGAQVTISDDDISSVRGGSLTGGGSLR